MPVVMQTNAKELLNVSLAQLPWVGRQRANLLRKLDIYTARDLLFDFPRDYQDLSDERPIAQLDEDQLQSGGRGCG